MGHRANPRSSFVVCLWLAPLLSRMLSWLHKRFWNLYARAHARCMKPVWLHHEISHLPRSLAGPGNSFSRFSWWSVRKAFLDSRGNLGCVSSSGPWAVLKNKTAPTCLAEQRCWIQVWIKDSWTTVTLRYSHYFSTRRPGKRGHLFSPAIIYFVVYK